MILCIDTSSAQLILALYDSNSNQLNGELLLEPPTHGQALVPAMDFLLGQFKQQLSGIAVCVGPGSFTGLRVGLATAQGLAFSLNLPVVGISSLELLAANQGEMEHTVWALIDARQKMLYAAPFAWQDGQLVRLAQDGSASVERLLELIEKPACLLGSGALAYADQFSGFSIIEPRRPSGETLARLAIKAFAQNQYIDPQALKPNYCRPSDAEARFGLPMEQYNLL